MIIERADKTAPLKLA